MKKKILLLPLLLLAVVACAEPIVRVVNANGNTKSFATDDVRKLVLSADQVNVVNQEGSVLLSVPLTEIARVEFADGEPITENINNTLQSQEKVVKIIENGQVYILNSNKKYTIMGVEVEQK